MKSILLTRSQEDNFNIIRILEKDNNITLSKNSKNDVFIKSFKYICSPLIKYKNLEINSNVISGYNNIIITSYFASKILVSWFSEQETMKKIFNIWVVGNLSAKLLSDNNFPIVYVAQNVDDLIKKLPKRILTQTIYLSSNEITKNLSKEITRQIIYEVIYARRLNQIEEIKKGLDYVLLYSQNSAKTLNRLLIDNNLLPYLSNTIVITISKNVADNIRFFPKNVIYCVNEKPEQILELLLSHHE
ncbi:MAG: hypothetical protein LN588_02770 [Rickettsia endosymbiont of Bryobia graminum]|nr:hypothetical protein [Rickettsia endosymbiont of Bryobia graminum]